MLFIVIALFGFWIVSKENKTLAIKMRLLFFISLLILIILTYVTSLSMITFLPKLIISLLLLALTGAFLNAIKENKIAQWLVVAFCVFSTYQLEQKINDLFTPRDIETKKMDVGKDQIQSTLVKYVDNGEILVEMAPNDVEKLTSWLESKKATIKRAFSPQSSAITKLDDYYLIDIPNNSQTEAILSQLKNIQYIEWAESNELIPMEFPQKYNPQPKSDIKLTNDPSVNMQWHLQHLEMEKYYLYFKQNSLQPKKKSKLFILDTGIDLKHEDLNNPVGQIDKQGHGTHCAGVAAAITNNNVGVASMAPSGDWVSVHSIQVIGDIGFGTQEQIISGIIKAADNGADVISMSLGGITNQAREKAYNDAVKYANTKGAIVVVAAGNANLDGKRYSPANAENVITVSSINEKNEKSGFSNHVQNIGMGIAAPGERILATTPANTYTSFNGTSMAAPQVAGLIAIMKALKPEIRTQEVFQILKNTGKDTQNTARTGKLIHPLGAIEALTNGHSR